jgi:hypothetical protein
MLSWSLLTTMHKCTLAAVCSAGNSVYLAEQADSPQLAVVDAVTINQGKSGWEGSAVAALHHWLSRPCRNVQW